MTGGQAIRFYFDYESPNAYLAWTQLPALAARHQATVENREHRRAIVVRALVVAPHAIDVRDDEVVVRLHDAVGFGHGGLCNPSGRCERMA